MNNYKDKTIRAVIGKIKSNLVDISENTGNSGNAESLTVQGSKYYEPKCIVSFIDDDGALEINTNLRPIIEQYNIPYSFAYMSYTTPSDSIDSSMLQWLSPLLNNYGCEIISHVKHEHMNTLTEQQLRDTMAQSSSYLASKVGDKYKPFLAYPFGENSELVRKIARKHFSAAFTVNGYGYNIPPINTYAMYRYAVNTNTLADMKAYFDNALAKNAWCVFYTHAVGVTGTVNQNLKDLIDYIKSKNVEIKSISDAFQSYRNQLDLGIAGTQPADFTSASAYSLTKDFRVGIDGVTSVTGADYKIMEMPNAITDTVDKYEVGKTTICYYTATVVNADTTNFPCTGYATVLTTVPVNSTFDFYTSNNYGATQILINSSVENVTMYKRIWSVSGSAWSSWYPVGVGIIQGNDYIKTDTALASTKDKTVFYNQVSGATSGYPLVSVTGKMTTDTSIGLNGGVQEWKPLNNTNRYFRRSTMYGGTSWGKWSEVLMGYRWTQTQTISDISAGTTASFNVSVTGADVGQNVVVTPKAFVDGLIYQGYVSAAGTVTVKLTNVTASTITGSSMDFNITLIAPLV